MVKLALVLKYTYICTKPLFAKVFIAAKIEIIQEVITGDWFKKFCCIYSIALPHRFKRKR